MKNKFLEAISGEDVEKVNKHVFGYLSSNWEGTRPVIEGVVFVCRKGDPERPVVLVKAVPSYRQQPLAAIEARLVEINSNPDLLEEWELFAAWKVPSVVHAKEAIFEALCEYWLSNKPALGLYECSPETACLALTDELQLRFWELVEWEDEEFLHAEDSQFSASDDDFVESSHRAEA